MFQKPEERFDKDEMITEEYKQKIRAFVFEKFPLARKRSMADDDLLIETGIVDSLGVLELVGYIEKSFGIIVSDEDLSPENFQSVSALAGFVWNKKTAASRSDVKE
jgi:acyl carrier protein